MIEKFTQEELDIIKRELGVSDKTLGSKSNLLSEQKAEVIRLFAQTQKQKECRAEKDIWDALLKVADHTLQNYQKVDERLYGGTATKKYHRYSSIFMLDRYREMMDELLGVVKKYIRVE